MKLTNEQLKLAADTVKTSFARSIALYDNALHEKEVFAEQLMEDFRPAIRDGLRFSSF